MNPLKFYILDDALSTARQVSHIIESRSLGEVMVLQSRPEKAAAEILALSPDIVILDLVSPARDGLPVLLQVRETAPDVGFIIITVPEEKAVLSETCARSIETFLVKPCGSAELENALRRAAETRQMKALLSGILALTGGSFPFSSAASVPASAPASPCIPPAQSPSAGKIRRILASLGMLGESGTRDIINVCLYLKEHQLSYDSRKTLNTYAASLGENPKIVKQRIRRAVKRGLTNTAALGIEDYYNDLFDQYAHALFHFNSIRAEMDCLRGKSAYGGRPSVDKFFEGLEVLSEE